MSYLQLFGSPDLTGPNGERSLSVLSQPKRLALLAYMAAATPHGFHSRDKLLGLLWPESDLDHARNSLRQSIHFLRRRLGPEALINLGEGEVALTRESLECDVVEFDHALNCGDWERALALYRADLLEGFFLSGAAPFEQWLEEERGRLRRGAITAARHLSEKAARKGADEEARAWAERALALDPLDEGSVRHLIEALTKLGDGASAARVYQEFAGRLAREYELEPSPETTAAMESIRKRAASAAAAFESLSAKRPASDLEASAVIVASAGAPADEDVASHEAVEPPLPITAAVGRAQTRVDPRWLRRRARGLAGVGRTGSTPLQLGLAVALTALLVAWAQAIVPVLSWNTEAPSPVKSVAVLPFRTIGPGSDDGFFAEAVHQEILTQLAHVQSLRVIARGSVVDYRIDFDDNRTIAQHLGVGYLIRGAIQISGDHVRMWARLVDGGTDEQLWASSYECPPEELFRIQLQVAEQVAEALQIHFPAEERARAAARPTANPEAYEAWLRGRLHASRAVNRDDAREAIRRFEDAVTLDPDFASAWAALSFSKLLLAYVYEEREQVPSAESALRRAVALAPHDADTWLAEAYHLSYGAQDYDGALDRVARVLAVHPSDPDALSLRGFIERRKGMWLEAAASMTAALELDPKSYTTTVVLAEMLMRMRQYPRAERLLDRAIAISPGGELAHVQKALLHLNGRGDVMRARSVLDGYPAPLSPKYRTLPALVALFAGEMDDARRMLLRAPASIKDDARSVEEFHMLGLVHILRGDRARAAAYGDSIVRILSSEAGVSGSATSSGSILRTAEATSYLALAAALAGQEADAVSRAERAGRLLPLDADAYAGTEILERLAEVYALTGRVGPAVEVLERLLSVPSRVTPHVLRLHPVFAPLRDDPRFLALLDTPASDSPPGGGTLASAVAGSLP